MNLVPKARPMNVVPKARPMNVVPKARPMNVVPKARPMNTARRLLVLAGVAAIAAALCTGVGPAAAVSGRRALAPPQHTGTLRIAGALRDGSAITAAGLAWRPGRLPAGDRLLSFAVAYAWRACAIRCRTAADSTVTPFAASRYIVGHVDTGRRLRVTEMATEVVRTKGADFNFVVLSSSASASSRPAVAGYRAGRAPLTEFVNGTPESRTASDAEYFQVDPPHYAQASGSPRQFYRVDAGKWRPM